MRAIFVIEEVGHEALVGLALVFIPLPFPQNVAEHFRGTGGVRQAGSRNVRRRDMDEVVGKREPVPRSYSFDFVPDVSIPGKNGGGVQRVF